MHIFAQVTTAKSPDGRTYKLFIQGFKKISFKRICKQRPFDYRADCKDDEPIERYVPMLLHIVQ